MPSSVPQPEHFVAWAMDLFESVFSARNTSASRSPLEDFSTEHANKWAQELFERSFPQEKRRLIEEGSLSEAPDQSWDLHLVNAFLASAKEIALRAASATSPDIKPLFDKVPSRPSPASPRLSLLEG
jgi:hypothetical protein